MAVLRAAESGGGAVVAAARLLVQRLHAAPQRGRGNQSDQQGRELHRMPPPMAQQNREDPDHPGHAISPALRCDLAVERGGQPRAVGHHQEAAAGSRHQIARQRQNLVGGRLVEIAGRLVGEQQQRLHRQRAADRDPLLLAAGQLLGIALQQAAEPQPLHQFAMPRGIVTAGNARLERQVIVDIQARDQVELLEHQAEPIAPQGRPAGIGQIRYRRRRRA